MTSRMKGARMNPLARKEQILDTAIELSIEHGYRQLTRRAVAKKIQCTQTLISHYYASIKDLREAVLNTAIEREVLPILAQDLTIGGVLTDTLKQKVIAYLTTNSSG